MDQETTADTSATVCHRCGAIQESGGPLFYFVKIEAYPVPELPPLTAEDLQRNFAEELALIIDEARDLSPQELMDQVYRQMTLHLCPRCYRKWIDNPTP